MSHTYRKKPAVIEAFKFDYNDDGVPAIPHTAWPTWLLDAAQLDNNTTGAFYYSHFSNRFRICTLEGDHTVTPGDWIIRGVAGELYPCKPSIFDATYEHVPADEAEQPDA
jgi:hypothetical protein